MKRAGRGRDPDGAAFRFAQALERQRSGRLDEALALYREALDCWPHDPETHYNMGLLLQRLGRTGEAISALEAALRLRSDYAAARNNLGVLLAETGRLDEARAILGEALRRHGPHPFTWNNLGIVLADLGEPDQAALAYRRALALEPGYADALANLGIVLAQERSLAAAETAYRRALAVMPDFAKARFNLSLLLLLEGRFAEGWEAHEWRLKGGGRNIAARSFPMPEWQGEPLAGKSLLLHAEQGFGDSLQFIRYALRLKEMGAEIVVEAPKPLHRLLASMQAVDRMAGPAERTDYHLALLSAPHRLGEPPTTNPYLFADPFLVDGWRRRLAHLSGRKIGLVWAGDPRPQDFRANLVDARRSTRLEQWTDVLAVPGLSFVSLQMGAGASQLARFEAAGRLFDPTAELTDFADSAALIETLDLVITVDTAVAHLAGALGRPVWILSRFDGCWRWLQKRDDSPWYPTARLFRQEQAGDWETVFARVADSLSRWSRTG